MALDTTLTRAGRVGGGGRTRPDPTQPDSNGLRKSIVIKSSKQTYLCFSPNRAVQLIFPLLLRVQILALIVNGNPNGTARINFPPSAGYYRLTTGCFASRYETITAADMRRSMVVEQIMQQPATAVVVDQQMSVCCRSVYRLLTPSYRPE